MATSTGEHSSTVQAAEKGIFDGVYFAVIPTNDLSDEETNTVCTRCYVYIPYSLLTKAAG